MFPPVLGAPNGQLRESDTRTAPFNQVCRLLVTFTNGTTDLASGWLVSRSTIITARHVFDGPRRVSRINAFPGFGGNVPRFGRHETTEFDPATNGADCAAVFLQQTVDPRLRFFRAGRLDSVAVPSVVSVLGYKVEGDGRDQFMGSGPLLAPPDALIRYGVTTTDGLSGGPVFADANPVVVGVHRDFRQATPIDDRLLQEINDWARRVPVVAVSLAVTTSRTIAGPAPETVLAPVASAAVGEAVGAAACEAFGRRIGTAIGAELEPSERVTLIVTDTVEARALTFRSECIVAGIAQVLPRRVTCPQLFVGPPVPEVLSGTAAREAASAHDRMAIREGTTDRQPRDDGGHVVLLLRLDDVQMPGQLVACGTLLGADGLIRSARTWAYADADTDAAPWSAGGRPSTKTGASLKTSASRSHSKRRSRSLRRN